MAAQRKSIDCRDYPSHKNCSLKISGTEEEVLDAEMQHAASVHGHENTAELREQIKQMLGRRSFLLVTGAVIVVALVAACNRRPQPEGGTNTAASQIPAYAATLNEQIPNVLKENGIPGAIVLIRSPDKGNWSATFGVRSVGSSEPLSMDDTLRIGSITKSMTATVILQLQQEGKLSITDPISRYVPGVPNGDNITIEQLGEMRSGLFNYTDDKNFNATLATNPDTVWTPQQLLAIAFAHPPNFAPGSQYEYNNTNYALLGMTIEKLTESTAAAALQARIFGPLGLRNTALPAPADSALPDPHPQGYMWGPDVAFEEPLPEAQLRAALAGELKPADHTNDNPSWAWMAGGVISRADEVADFVEAMVSGRLLNDTTRQWRLANMKPTNPSDPGGISKLGFATYGFGIEGAGPMYGHPGNIVGFSGVAAHDPKAGTTVVILTTVYLTPQGGPPQNALFKPIFAQLYPEVAAQLPGGSAPAPASQTNGSTPPNR